MLDYAPQGLRYELELLLGEIEASKNLAKQESGAALSESRGGRNKYATSALLLRSSRVALRIRLGRLLARLHACKRKYRPHS
jgi:hypothetical protein